MDLTDPGSARTFTIFEKSPRAMPYGMIPGDRADRIDKSTTLYATLNVVNRPEVNIITVEDPVEYRCRASARCRCNKAGSTFAAACARSCARTPTSSSSVRSATTRPRRSRSRPAHRSPRALDPAHERRAEAITRLTEMGIEPFPVGSAVDCVLSPSASHAGCARSARALPAHGRAAGEHRLGPARAGPAEPQLHRPVGCANCQDRLQGRLALHEVMG